MTQIELTPSQRAVLDLAVETDGRVENFPKNLGGGARAGVMRGLLLNGLIVADGAGHALTEAGYEAVGRLPPQADNDAGVDINADSGADTEAKVEIECRTEAEVESADEPAATPDDESAQTNTETADSEGASANDTRSAVLAPQKKREQSRVDQVVALLLRPQGVTIKEVMEATSWQQHSVRGFFAGALKKKGYELISDKNGKEERVYRIKTETRAEAENDRTGRSDEAE
ncbi:DUF3489 domain-containing protein [Lysobacter antibioticus]|uniref:DUF3489 domain-containing protein n=1 Tax=Lysobacter antibioticus TaxID=84531 RepID=UPI000563D58C|nr:DUF3489 domain-containing protein [Lysobacter antibioticus]